MPTIYYKKHILQHIIINKKTKMHLLILGNIHENLSQIYR